VGGSTGLLAIFGWHAAHAERGLSDTARASARITRATPREAGRLRPASHSGLRRAWGALRATSG